MTATKQQRFRSPALLLWPVLAAMWLSLSEACWNLAELRTATPANLAVIAVVLGCAALTALALARPRRAADWLSREPRWIWPLPALIGLGLLSDLAGLAAPAVWRMLLHGQLSYGWIVAILHFLYFPEHWKRALCWLSPAASPRPLIAYALLPLLSTLVLYSLYAWIVRRWFGLDLHPRHPLCDPLLQLSAAYVLLAFSRRAALFAVVQALEMGILHLGNAVKLGYLGGPLGPDDPGSLYELLRIMGGLNLALVALPLGGLAALMLVNFRPRWPQCLIAAVLLVAISGALYLRPAALLRPLDRAFGNIPWNQEKNFARRGPSVHFLQEYARRRAELPLIPDAVEVNAALNGRDFIAAGDLRLQQRDVYILLLESFWDPSVLGAAGLSGDPLHPAFRELWAACGYSRALSPTAFGATPNAEYELLCGAPYSSSRVVFANGVRNQMPCLPALLKASGFDTLAFHPNVASFWNRDNVYPRIGFERFLAEPAFVKDDLNGRFLSDESLFRQVWAKLAERPAGRPRLVYVLSITGHYDYPLNQELRPKRIEAADPLVERYANSIWYSSKELAEFVGRLREQDPTALIVVLGDHLPYLGSNRRALVESGLLAPAREKYDATMYRDLAATLLLVIDGTAGPLQVGELSMFQIPQLVLRLLGASSRTWMDLFEYEGLGAVRPFTDALLLLGPDGRLALCRTDDQLGECAAAWAWRGQTDVLVIDMAVGDQHALSR